MSTYLDQVGSTYYFRRVVPLEFRPYIRTSEGHPRAEWKVSLRTKSREEAKRAIPHYVIDTDAQIEAAAKRWLTVDSSPAEGALKFHDPEHRPALRGALKEGAITLPSIQGGPGGVLLTEEIVEGWARERKPTAKGKDAYMAVARWFYERVGEIPMSVITRLDVIKFKNALLDEGHTPANTNRKLNRLRTLFQWAVDNDYMDSNVAARIGLKGTAAAGIKRQPFALEDLNAIFGSPVYCEGDRPKQGRGAAAYWLPLMALFTGARLEELGQLRVTDLQCLPYQDAKGAQLFGWFLQITEMGEGDMKLKNAGSERLVPVHPQLERLGLIKYVATMEELGQGRMFPGLTPGAYGRLTHKWGQWFSVYLRRVCNVKDTRKVFHSFRHTFKDVLRNVGVEEAVGRQLMGHGGQDVADDYGSGFSLLRTTQAMEQFRIPGLKLPRSSAYKSTPLQTRTAMAA